MATRFLALLLMAAAPLVGAQQPSVQETATFISQRLFGCGEIRATYPSTVRSSDGSVNPTLESPSWLWKKFELNAGRLTWEQYHVGRSDRTGMKYRYSSRGNIFGASASLRDLSPEIAIEEVGQGKQTGVYYLTVACSSGACMTSRDGYLKYPGEKHAFTDSMEAYASGITSWEFAFYNRDSETRNRFEFEVCGGRTEAERLQRAFAHLIRQAGGKKPLF